MYHFIQILFKNFKSLAKKRKRPGSYKKIIPILSIFIFLALPVMGAYSLENKKSAQKSFPKFIGNKPTKNPTFPQYIGKKPKDVKTFPELIGKKTGVELQEAKPEDITSNNYPDVLDGIGVVNWELSKVIKLMSEYFQIKIIMDPSIGSQKISIISYTPITVAEVYQAFLSALAIHDLTVIRTGSFLKVVKTEVALKSNLRVYEGNKKINTDQFLTSIIKLKNISAASLEAKMKPFIDAKAVKSLIFYPPSNAVIISDYGLNVERIRKIIKSLDVPSKDFIFKVFPIKHARAETLVKIINNLLPTGNRPAYSYRRASAKKTQSQQFVNISALSSDERTNSIIVMGNKSGIDKVQELIKELDYYKDPELAGGIYVYKVKHGTAEELATTLNDLIGNTSSSKETAQKNMLKSSNTPASRRGGGSSSASNLQDVNTAQSFQDVRIIAEKNTNSLLIVSNKYNYETILNILKKVDISRNQVFVKSIIMELSTQKSNDWQMANYYFPETGEGIVRMGYGIKKLTDIGSPGGATLFFPLSLLNISKSTTTDITNFANLNNLDIKKDLKIPTLSSFINFLQTNVGANILSTPQVMALDHQQAEVKITEHIPILGERTTQTNIANQFTVSAGKETVETSLIITPHINPDVNSIRLEIEQKIDNISKEAEVPEALRDFGVAVKKRTIKTFINLKDQETAVLGGLVKETNSKVNSKIPILGDIPIIGWLFKNSETDRKKSNLIVFITPYIIRSAKGHKTILSRKLKERMDFIRQFTGKKDPHRELIEKMRPTELNSLEDFSTYGERSSWSKEKALREEEDLPYMDDDYYEEDVIPPDMEAKETKPDQPVEERIRNIPNTDEPVRDDYYDDADLTPPDDMSSISDTPSIDDSEDSPEEENQPDMDNLIPSDIDSIDEVPSEEKAPPL
ncbi:MAG: type II secretion system secretin GspD [Bdellovibrionales bacterium]|nr:type II secretion system secretin GspD [Bdellovibrionales bacterium]